MLYIYNMKVLLIKYSTDFNLIYLCLSLIAAQLMIAVVEVVILTKIKIIYNSNSSQRNLRLDQRFFHV